MTWFSLFLEHQTSHAAYFNARGLLYESVSDALLFSLSYWHVGNPISHQVVTWPTFSSFFYGSSYQPCFPPRYSDTTLWVCLGHPLNLFIIISIYWTLVSYMLSLDLSSFDKELQIGRLLSKLCFLFWIDMHAIWPVDGFKTSSWPSKVAAPTHRLGASKTWVPLGPHRLGSKPSPTKWVSPIRRLAYLTVGPTDLIWGPHDLQKTFKKIPKRPYPERHQDLACKTRQRWISTKQFEVYGSSCNQLNLSLLVVTD
jgi:hypothetical protein